MTAFAFHPELFERRATAIDALAKHECCQFQDFSSIDLLHDRRGLEVSGIASEAEAHAIARILQQTFPRWPCVDVGYQDHHAGQGWVAEISMNPEQ